MYISYLLLHSTYRSSHNESPSRLSLLLGISDRLIDLLHVGVQGASVVGVLVVVHGDVLIETRQPLVALLSGRSDSKWVIVSPVGFVVDESSLVRSGDVSGVAVVVHTAVEELSLSIGQRLGEFLASHVHIGVEVDVSEAHSGGETESKSDGPDIVVTGHIIEQTLETSSYRPLEEHGIGGSGEEQETSVSEALHRGGSFGGVHGFPKALGDLLHVFREPRNCSSQHHTLRKSH